MRKNAQSSNFKHCLNNNLKLTDLAYLTCRGGWPGVINMEHEIARNQTSQATFETIAADMQANEPKKMDVETVSSYVTALSVVSGHNYTEHI